MDEALPIARQVADAVEQSLLTLPRAHQVETALAKRGAMVIVKDLSEAFDLANQIAPEHLELELRNPSRWLPRVKAAGDRSRYSCSPLQAPATRR